MKATPRKCQKVGKKCGGVGQCHAHEIITVKRLPASICDTAPSWQKPASLDELYQMALDLAGQKAYYLVGHTGVGVYKDDGPYVAYVDLKGVKDLFKIQYTKGGSLSVGAGVSLTDLISRFNQEAKNAGFEYLAELAGMISKTAHISVRNVS